ncbi:hypothetical protein M9458_035518, partial [Cirrhinus mrigala]
SHAPPWPVDAAAPPGLLAPSSPPWPSKPTSPGSLVPQSLPWLINDHPPPLDSTPPAAPRPSFPPALPWLPLDPQRHPGLSGLQPHLGLLHHLLCCCLPPPWLLPPSAPLWVTCKAVAWVLPGSSCS